MMKQLKPSSFPFSILWRAGRRAYLNHNNMSSLDFIGHLFLAFGDLFLDDELREDNDSIR